MGEWYVTLEDTYRALDGGDSIRSRAQVARLIESGARDIDSLCRLTQDAFVPVVAARTFDWPPRQAGGEPWRLWLDDNPLISLSSLTSGGVTIAASDYFLRPDTGPPYDRIEIDLASSAAFASGDTHQRAISATGTWGAYDSPSEIGAGVLAEALDATETAIDVNSACAAVAGTGSLLLCGTERMRVTARTAADTTQDTVGALTAQLADVSVTVADGTAFTRGETILIDSERMMIEEIAGNVLTVRRRCEGTVLAAHSTGASVYAYRTLTVDRGVLGTTAATHDSAAALTAHKPPTMITMLNLAYVLNGLRVEAGGYAGEKSGGRGAAAASKPLEHLEAKVRRRYGRQMRTAAV